MAKKSGNGASGRIGNVIHYTRKGVKCMRIIPAHVSNPRSAAQTNQRNKLGMSSRFLKSLNRFILTGYQATELDTPANEARQHLMRDCFDITDNGPVLDYSRISIARGLIPAPVDCTMTKTGNSTLISWTPMRGSRSADIKVMIAMYIDEEKEGISQMLSNVAYQKDGSCNVPVPIHSKPVHVWMFFSNADLYPYEHIKKVSNSVYLGEIA